MDSRTLQHRERAVASIADRTRYHRLCPRWLRPLLHVFRLRDINRTSAEITLGLLDEVARLDARVRELEQAASGRAAPAGRRVLFDVTCTLAHDNKTGIQRVVRNLAREFSRLKSPGAEPLLVQIVSGGLRRADDFVAGPEASGDESAPACIVPRAGDILVIADSGWERRDQYRQAIRSVRAAGGRALGVIHDLIPLKFPQFTIPSGTENFRRWLGMLLEECDALAGVSKTVADEVESFLAENPDPRRAPLPVGHFLLGGSVEELLSVPPAGTARVARARAAGPALFLMVGTLEPRKDHACALDAFESLWAKGSDAVLVVAGADTWNPPPVAERIRRHRQLGKKLFRFEACDDAELRALYASADALLFASQAEGFGLPLVEAAAFGLPIVCSDIPVFREICGDGAAYFAAGDARSLERAIETWSGDKKLGRIPSSRDIRRLTWEESARMLLATALRLSPAPAPTRV